MRGKRFECDDCEGHGISKYVEAMPATPNFHTEESGDSLVEEPVRDSRPTMLLRCSLRARSAMTERAASMQSGCVREDDDSAREEDHDARQR